MSRKNCNGIFSANEYLQVVMSLLFEVMQSSKVVKAPVLTLSTALFNNTI
jgi:hypothetical protein